MAYVASNLGCDLLLDSSGDLSLGSSGDLALTGSGRACVMQDVMNLLDTLPGDLFAHPSFGSGLQRLVGEEDRSEFESMVARAIADALTYDGSVGPRIDPETIDVAVERVVDARPHKQARISIAFMALGETWTSRLNLVWGLSTRPFTFFPVTSSGGQP